MRANGMLDFDPNVLSVVLLIHCDVSFNSVFTGSANPTFDQIAECLFSLVPSSRWPQFAAEVTFMKKSRFR